MRFALGHGVLEYRSIGVLLNKREKRSFPPFKSITPALLCSITPLGGAAPEFLLSQLFHFTNCIILIFC
jgi:hypothetical protein